MRIRPGIAPFAMLICLSLVVRVNGQASAEAEKQYETLVRSYLAAVQAQGDEQASAADDDQQEAIAARIEELEAELTRLRASLTSAGDEEQSGGVAPYDRSLYQWQYHNSSPENLRQTANYLQALETYRTLASSFEAEPSDEQSANYWIGVRCVPLEQQVRDFLSLEEGRGILVDEVVEESPAAECGLELKDVILDVGGAQISTVAELVEAIQASEGQTLTITINRQGEQQELELTPASRPTYEGEYRTLLQAYDYPLFDFDTMSTQWLLNNPLLAESVFVLPEEVHVTMEFDDEGEIRFRVTQEGEEQTLTLDEIDQLDQATRNYVLLQVAKLRLRLTQVLPNATYSDWSSPYYRDYQQSWGQLDHGYEVPQWEAESPVQPYQWNGNYPTQRYWDAYQWAQQAARDSDDGDDESTREHEAADDESRDAQLEEILERLRDLTRQVEELENDR